MGGLVPVDGGLTGTVLVVVQIATFVIGLVLAFAGERVHEMLVTLGAFLGGAVLAMLILPGILLTGGSGMEGILLTGVGVLASGGIAVVLTWVSIYFAVFLSGATAGLLVAAYLTGVWNPLWIGGGLLIVGLGGLFFGMVGIGIAFVAAYAGQATGYHGLRDMAFRINDLKRRPDSAPSGGTSGTAKFDEDGSYFETGGSSGGPSGRSDTFIPEDTVKESGPVRAWAMTILGVVCFGVLAVISGFAMGAPILAGILHPTARAGVLIVLSAAVCGRLAIKFYRPYIVLSTAFSGSILTAIALTSKRTLYLLSTGDLASALTLLERASMTFFGVMVAVFLVGSVIQIRHVRRSDPPI